MQSSRLPKKVLADIGGVVLIEHIINRILLSGAPKEDICFALAEENEENEIGRYLDKNQIPWMQGDPHDVLKRYIHASEMLSENDLLVRLTGDNPFIDYRCLRDNLAVCMKDDSIDFSYPYKLPLGMGFEIIRKRALDRQMEFTLQGHHREHVTTFIKENPSFFKIQPVVYFKNSEDIRVTVDYREDLDMTRKIWQYFKEQNRPNFCSGEIFKLYKIKPDFFILNRDRKQKKATEYDQAIDGK